LPHPVISRQVIVLLAVTGVAPPAVADQCAWPSAEAAVADATPANDAEASDPDQLPVQIQSGGSTEVTREGDAKLTGGVTISQGDRRVTADAASYDASERRFDVEGNVEFDSPELRLSGGSGSWTALGTGQFTGAEFELPQRPARGSAAHLEMTREGVLKLDGVRFTTCPVGSTDWELRASSIEIDQATQQGHGRNVRVDLKGIPILYTPVISFPVGPARKSGFLFPSFGNSDKSGFEVGVPYYFNLAPNYDLTLTPFTMTRRGIGSDVELRGLQPWGGATLAGTLLPHDRVLGERRWVAFSEGELTPWTDARAHWRGEGVSDDEMWKDMRRRIGSQQPRLLARDAAAEQRFEGWGLSGSLYARALQWQVLQTEEASTRISAPYQRAPQVGLRLRNQADVGLLAGFLPALARPQLETALELEYNRFTLPRAALAGQAAGGERAHLLGSVALPLLDPAWWLVPRLSLNAASYRTEQAMSDGRRRASRSIPTFSLDTGLVFERNTRLGERELLQSLEPRLLYVQTPYRAQESLPLYDSAPLDFNFESLYATNSFSGVDRVADARQLSFGGVSRWLNASDGEEQLRIGVVQRYQFREQRITAEPGTVNRRFSDLLLAGAAHLTRAWWLDAAVQYDPEIERTERSVLRARYTTTDYRSASLAYRYTRNQSEQLDLAWQWPLTARKGSGECAGRWFSAGRIQYSMKDSRVTDSLLGVEYDAGCWVLRMGVERLSTGLSQANTRFLLQLELVGLSRIGANALKVLRDNVPGYRPLASDGGLPYSP
jgi:LPS-assembly protein